VQVLRALASRLPLEEGIELADVAHACEGFSGADLGALLADAQLAAVHELLDSTTPNGQVACKRNL
jgi:peroxin-1